MRKVRVKRGSPALEIYPLPTLERFTIAWDLYFPGYGNSLAVRTNWGNLNRSQLYDKLKEVAAASNAANLQHYHAWLRHLYLTG